MSSDLKPWFAVVTPHEDIREGRLSEAVFAANLWAVVQETAPDVYLDAGSFFAKTYLTSGLTNILKKATKAISGDADAGDRILSLQTTFGGGKTHALVALYHLAKHNEEMDRLPGWSEFRKTAGKLAETPYNVAVFTNRTCDATQGRVTESGIHTRTLWGELALQLGGAGLYRKIEANDQARTVPQGLFVEILRQTTPCLILLDELADYCVGASAVEIGSTTLADQTISFAQELTEAVSQVKGVALVATLPASHLEVASSEKGQEILNRLERRFGRMSADIKPVADDEIYEVVRRRLFESLGDKREHEKIVDAYMKMYAQHRNEVPPEAVRGTYRERLISAYPFHPTLIDGFNLRWGSHGDFQRTRGVLRLLASIVGDLWQRRNTETQSQPLIQPCHVHWNLDALHAALTRLWGVAYESVVSNDVVGDRANAALLDEERAGDYTVEKIAQGLSASILLGSFGGQADRTGYSTNELKLCASRPQLNWNYTDGALLAFEDRAFFLRCPSLDGVGKRYWFGTKPTLVNLIVRYRRRFADQDFEDEIMALVQTQVKELRTEPATWRIVVDPETDLPEQKSLSLLIMPSEFLVDQNGGLPSSQLSVEDRLMILSRKCGSRERHYPNTLLFLLPSRQGLTKLQNCLREVMVLEAVRSDFKEQLSPDDQKDLSGRIDNARKSIAEALSGAFSHAARIEKQNIVITALTEAKPTLGEHLQAAWRQLVEDEEWVLRKVGPVTLQKVGLVPKEGEGGIRVKDAVEAFLRYTDKPMIASRDAVIQGLIQACRDRLIGIGMGLNLSSLQKKWCGEVQPLPIADDEGLWIIPPFATEAPLPVKPTAPPVLQPGSGDGIDSGEEGTDIEIPPLPTGGSKRTVQKLRISGQVSLESWAEVFRCFINPAARMNLKKLRLGIDFEMDVADGQPLSEDDTRLKAMKESARQLGLDLKEME